MQEPTPPALPTPPPVLDVGTLDALGEAVGEADPTLVADVVADFLSDGPARLAALGEAAVAGDRDAFRSVAHTLKSSSANLGARRLSSVCAAIEALLDRGRVSEAADRVPEARESWEEVAAELRGLYA